jgi:DNA-binding transcriptional regulator YdaS (Cro superfamily)
MNTSPIKAYREASGLSLEKFGLMFGVHKSTVLRWEAGRIPAERVIEIENATKIPRQKLRPNLFKGGGAA